MFDNVGAVNGPAIDFARVPCGMTYRLPSILDSSFGLLSTKCRTWGVGCSMYHYILRFHFAPLQQLDCFASPRTLVLSHNAAMLLHRTYTRTARFCLLRLTKNSCASENMQNTRSTAEFVCRYGQSVSIPSTVHLSNWQHFT